MIITTTPAAIPVTTANPPTEMVAAETALKVPVPAAKPSTGSQNSRTSTETGEQPRSSIEQNKQEDANQKVDSEAEQQNSGDERQRDPREDQQLRREVEALKKTDREVKNHERAHASVGGQYAGAPSYSYVTGPDGKRYAVAGEVSIDTSKVAGDPQATIDKMQQVQRAALAPADPSAQDLRVAAIAGQIANQARAELLSERAEARESQINLSNSSADSAESNIRDTNNNLGNSNLGNSNLDNKSLENNTIGTNTQTSALEKPINPFFVRRASQALNLKIANSGALDNEERLALIARS